MQLTLSLQQGHKLLNMHQPLALNLLLQALDLLELREILQQLQMKHLEEAHLLAGVEEGTCPTSQQVGTTEVVPFIVVLVVWIKPCQLVVMLVLNY